MKTTLLISSYLLLASTAFAQQGREVGEFGRREIPEAQASRARSDSAVLQEFKKEISAELGKLGSAAQRLAPAIQAYQGDPSDPNLATLLQAMAAAAATGKRGCDEIVRKAEATQEVTRSAYGEVVNGLRVVQGYTSTRQHDSSQLRQTTEALQSGLKELAQVAGDLGFGSDEEIPAPLRKMIEKALRAANATKVAFKINEWSFAELTEAEAILRNSEADLARQAEKLGFIVQDYQEMAEAFSYVGSETGVVAEGGAVSRRAAEVTRHVKEVVGVLEKGANGMRQVLLGLSPEVPDRSKPQQSEPAPKQEASRSLLDQLNQYSQ
ncbi:MAG: hypothetical protein HY735_03555 [Verrucomicrobia bacterium]|nr:hypothetical protein [Verrucomicrobiota bacterium]